MQVPISRDDTAIISRTWNSGRQNSANVVNDKNKTTPDSVATWRHSVQHCDTIHEAVHKAKRGDR